MTEFISSSADSTISGDGAMALVTDILNSSWQEGNLTKAQFQAAVIAATENLGSSAPDVTAGIVGIPSVSRPTIDTSQVTPGELVADFTSQRDALIALLYDKFSAFMSAYFPNSAAAYDAAVSWLQSAMNRANAGVPLEDLLPLFIDDRDRILEDASRASDAQFAQFAGRRFPLPPGALAGGVLQIQQKAQDEIAESSRKLTPLYVELKKFNAQITLDLNKFSADKLADLRNTAISAASDYIKSLVSGADIGVRVSSSAYDTKAKMVSAAADFYRADIGAKEMISKVEQFNASSSLEAAVKNQQKDLSLIDERMKALLSEAELLSRICTSLFNNLHAQASVGISASHNVGFSYSNDTVSAAPTITN